MSWPRWVGRALRECLVEHDWQGPPPGLEALLRGHPLALLVAAARRHHVHACVYRSLRELPTAAPATAAMRSDYVAGQRHQLRLKADLVRLSKLLTGLGVPWCLVKGPYLSEIAYREHDLRHYVDLDIVVARPAFSTVVNALQAADYDVVRRDWTLARAQLAGEIDLVSPFGTAVDLHWALLYHEEARAAVDVAVEDVLARVRTVTIAGAEIPVPDPVDTLMHLALHACREGGVRLQWLKDIDQVVRNDPPDDWYQLVDRCASQSLALVVGTLLQRTSTVLDAPVPDEVLDALLPVSWRTVLRMVDLASPPQRSAGHRSVGSFVTRASRSSPKTTLTALRSSSSDLASRAIRGRLGQARVKPHETVAGPLDERGDPRELDCYLQAVAGQPGVDG